jgi:hypothetical protein
MRGKYSPKNIWLNISAVIKYPPQKMEKLSKTKVIINIANMNCVVSNFFSSTKEGAVLKKINKTTKGMHQKIDCGGKRVTRRKKNHIFIIQLFSQNSMSLIFGVKYFPISHLIACACCALSAMRQWCAQCVLSYTILLIFFF